MTAVPPPRPPIGLDRPHGLGDTMRVAWQTMRARYRTYLLISLLPAVVGLVWALVLGVLVAVAVLPSLPGGDLADGPGPALGVGVGLGAAALVGYLVVLVVSTRAGGMQTVLTRHTLEGGRPDLSQLWQETRGYVRRMLVLLLLGVALLVLVSVVASVVSGTVVATSLGLAGGEDPSGTAMLPVVGGWLLYLVFYVALIWVSVRLTPVAVVVGLERRGGMAALRRSWRLTHGHFWRTLGYSIVGSLIPLAIVYLVTMISVVVVFLVLAATLADQITQPGTDPMTLVAPVLLASALGYLPTIIAAVLVGPFLGCFTTAYSTDLARRRATDEPVSSPEGGWQPRPYPVAPPQWFGPGGSPPGPGLPPGQPPPVD